MLVGKVISHYKLLERIGEGGMGQVYKAEDLRLGRSVALKLLTRTAMSEPEQKARFIREAQAAAALDHPNICTVYEIDEADGQNFIAMAHLKGHSLKERNRTAQIPISEAVELAIQTAEGLGHAHRHGVIHRDIKPANLFLTLEGVLKVIDFGLATVLGQSTVTMGATLVGTVAYMSPEQATGERIDCRTDIWSLAVVLYEMIAGQHPFPGDRELSVIYSILHNEPAPLVSFNQDVSADLQKVVSKALAKSKANRYASMEEFAQDLRVLRDWTPRPSITRTGISRSVPLSIGPSPSIAVLPFVDMSSGRDQEYLCEGIAEDIIHALMQVRGLHVVSRGSSFRFAGKAYDLAEIGQKLRVATVLEGSLRRQGDRLRISAHLIDTVAGYKVWARRFDLEMKDVFAIQDEISLAIANALKVTLLDKQNDGLVKRQTANMDAYAAYLRGRHSWAKRTPDAVRKAVEFYQEALRQDPDYAPAYAGLADAYIQPGYYGIASPKDVMPKGKAAALRALEIDATLAEARTSLGAISSMYEHAWKDSEHQFKLAIQSNPSYPTAHSWYGLFVLTPLQRFDEAGAHMKIAQGLDPLTPFVNTIVGMCHYFRRDYETAIRELQQVTHLDPAFPTAHLFLARASWDSGHEDESLEIFEKAVELYPNGAMFAAHLAYATARRGAREDAVHLLAKLKDQRKTCYVPATSLGILELGLGNAAGALDFFEEALEERYLYSIWLAVDPLYDEIRSEPRFQKLCKSLLSEVARNESPYAEA